MKAIQKAFVTTTREDAEYYRDIANMAKIE